MTCCRQADWSTPVECPCVKNGNLVYLNKTNFNSSFFFLFNLQLQKLPKTMVKKSGIWSY